ncbi:MAG: bifunctional phosphopantothenoylcysteine decarboxylase/phosphopantothenate--cysteine ligase CoaBC [Methanobacteriota archaeon]|nr:MAG: bifunctional phosphopantothenoylcysteine decarboxylase/phosphopantothenate--cysteine ligase CoaBC [Euryarchaeota archaeon]
MNLTTAYLRSDAGPSVVHYNRDDAEPDSIAPPMRAMPIDIYRAGRVFVGMHPADRLRGTKSLKLQGKTIVLGVTGSIAAVETVRLAHELIRHGADVHVVLTRSAATILHPNALQSATGHPVVTEITGAMEYLEMCGHDGRANLLLIAPCTANTIGKIAQGIDDSTVTTYATNALGSGIPILAAPAAHESMMDNPAVAANVRRLKELGVELIEPKREEEKAKMADVDTIVARAIRRLGPKDLADLRVLVIAGATVEPIDEVRVVTNRSSGGTGIELARAAFEHGADVELWLGRHEAPVPTWIPLRPFETTADLEAMAEKVDADICLVPAAVSDFTPAKPQKGKIPTRDGGLTLELQPTPKVLKLFRKGARKALIGFKAEAGVSEAELKARAMSLLKEADLDLVVANDVSKVKGGTTAITIFDQKGRAEAFEGSKALAAERVWRAILHGIRG